nr:hypothetical protein [Mycoplasmopsis agalactiae]
MPSSISFNLSSSVDLPELIFSINFELSAKSWVSSVNSAWLCFLIKPLIVLPSSSLVPFSSPKALFK